MASTKSLSSELTFHRHLQPLIIAVEENDHEHLVGTSSFSE
jgi:hypothetical protein